MSLEPDRRLRASVLGAQCLRVGLVAALAAAAASPAAAQRLPDPGMTAAVLDHARRAIPPIDRAIERLDARMKGPRAVAARAERDFAAAKTALEAAVRRRDSVEQAYWRDKLPDLLVGDLYDLEDLEELNRLFQGFRARLDQGLDGLTGVLSAWDAWRTAIYQIREGEQHRKGLQATRDLLLSLRRDDAKVAKFLAAIENRDEALLARLLGTNVVGIEQARLSAQSLLLVFDIGSLRQCFAVTPLCAGNLTYGIQ